jgi:two-component system, OmpR family, response regulator
VGGVAIAGAGAATSPTAPGEDGLTLARWLRENFRVGIIMLTGRGEIVDHILGLEMGADYYMPKPYHPRQLLAAVRSVLRRTSTQTPEKQTPSRSKARFAGWNLDLASRELFSPSGEEAPLTTGEFDLLAAFVNNQVLTRDRGCSIPPAIGRPRQKTGRSTFRFCGSGAS